MALIIKSNIKKVVRELQKENEEVSSVAEEVGLELEKKVETLVRKEHPRMADISLMRGREEVPDESL